MARKQIKYQYFTWPKEDGTPLTFYRNSKEKGLERRYPEEGLKWSRSEYADLQDMMADAKAEGVELKADTKETE